LGANRQSRILNPSIRNLPIPNPNPPSTLDNPRWAIGGRRLSD
jgi:hypothetical protein